MPLVVAADADAIAIGKTSPQTYTHTDIYNFERKFFIFELNLKRFLDTYWENNTIEILIKAGMDRKWNKILGPKERVTTHTKKYYVVRVTINLSWVFLICKLYKQNGSNQIGFDEYSSNSILNLTCMMEHNRILYTLWGSRMYAHRHQSYQLAQFIFNSMCLFDIAHVRILNTLKIHFFFQ